jgi:glutamate formiminotransferase/formiminotetrahydrofolate cyclodeaminase
MEEVGVKSQELMALQLKAVDEDTAAFKRVMDCFGMPKAAPEQQAARQAALEAANKAATLEPLGTLERTLPTFDCALAAAERGNPNSLSDAGVAGLMARAAALGAYYNVLINLPGISDEAWRRDVRLKADRLLAEAQVKADRLEKLLLSKLS